MRASLVFEGALLVLLVVVAGLPIFILVMLVPWWCLGGLMVVLKSSAWTLTHSLLTWVHPPPRPLPGLDAGGGPSPAIC